MSQSVQERLDGGLQELGLETAADAEEKLIAYLRLLAKWNHTYNLTAIRDEPAMVSQHLLDCLAVLPHFKVASSAIRSLADVGSGGGLPGIPLAIAAPQMQVGLVEASHKKASFLEQVRIELELSNVSVHCARVEAFKPKTFFDAVISRAFSSLADFAQLAGHLLAPGGVLLAMKGVRPLEEMAQLPPSWKLSQCISLNVPQLAAQRDLIIIQKL